MNSLTQIIAAVIFFMSLTSYGSDCSEIDFKAIHIIGTGGSIAGELIADDGTAYKPATIEVKDLLKKFPGLEKYEISAEQLCDQNTSEAINVWSDQMTLPTWQTLVNRIHEVEQDPAVKGIIITHGSNTIEYAAFFASLTLKNKRGVPIVFTGSMRPTDATETDAFENLNKSIEIANGNLIPSYNSRVSVVMGGRNFPGINVTKVFPNKIFGSFDYQVVGEVETSGGPTVGIRDLDINFPYFNLSEIDFSKTESSIKFHFMSPGANKKASKKRLDFDLVDDNTKAIILVGYGLGGLRSPYYEYLQCQEAMLNPEKGEAEACVDIPSETKQALKNVVFARSSVVKQGLFSDPWLSALVPYHLDPTRIEIFLRLYFSSKHAEKPLSEDLTILQDLLNRTTTL